MNPDYVWSAVIGAGLIYEGYALVSKRDGDTLSERTRSWFKTRTIPGKIAFATTWIAFATWFLFHIIFGGQHG